MTEAREARLEERIEAIEARQRAYGQHDPDCPVFKRAQSQRQTDLWLAKKKCTCWLDSGWSEGA